MDIKSIGLDMALRKLDEVTAQRDELLAALKATRQVVGRVDATASQIRVVRHIADIAIENCEVQS